MDEATLRDLEGFLVHLKDEVLMNKVDVVRHAERLLVQVRMALPKKAKADEKPQEAAHAAPVAAQEPVAETPKESAPAVSDEQALEEQQKAEEMGYLAPIDGETSEQHETRRRQAKRKK